MADIGFWGVARNWPVSAWHIGRHSHAVTEVVLINGGAEEVVVDGGGKRLHVAGDALVFRPGVAHEEWAAVGHGRLETFFFTSAEPPPAEVPLCVQDVDGRLRLLCGWLHGQREAADAAMRRQNEALFAALLAELARLSVRRGGGLAERARGLVKRDLGRRWTLEALAKEAGMSKFHFLRRYKAESGTTPMEDVRRVRATAARDMILTGRGSLKEVAAECGFGGALGLSRAFKGVFGCAPGGLRG